ncbi:hypothetical protein GG681_10955 [Epibacterium sp. SM1969]|uniref:Uncharacterized protein n=1 Tax=Tritonibacter aquimaris TaxID=2663379 RepID=A0A844AMG3_9RHOB|nr:hypothetical protein [Tritonibacter aquimaris]MQY43159.1 hypothetical protein [Tritonibacter aquimaris]
MKQLKISKGVVVAASMAFSNQANAEIDPEPVTGYLSSGAGVLDVIGETVGSGITKNAKYIGEAVGQLARPLSISEIGINLATENYAAAAKNFAEIPTGYVLIRGGAAVGRLTGGAKGALVGAAFGAKATAKVGDFVEAKVGSFADLFIDPRDGRQIRMDNVGLDPVEFARDFDLYSDRAEYERNLAIELNRREKEAHSLGRSKISTERRAVLNLSELQLQNSVASQTTGLASRIGSARPTASPDPDLEHILATNLTSPFTASIETPNTQSSGAFAGTEGLNIAGALRVFAFDSGNLEDGDRVRLTITDSSGNQFQRNILLTFGGTTTTRQVRRGLVNVRITALNLGSSPPNTGGLRVSGDVAGSRSGNFDLSVGQSGTLVVRVLGN